MNVSGKFVKKHILHSSFLIDNIYVVHDDLDIPLGSFKIQFGRGPKVHNGIDSVEAELGTEEFWRVRIGVDARPDESGRPRVSGEEYVLSDFTPDELARLQDTFSRVATRFKSV
jgi:PTH1 family peptidyl-tRNA hydrolase